MSAMPLPASPLPTPGNITPQSNSNKNEVNADDSTVSPAFASVLQQKVKGNAAGKAESKTASHAEASTTEANAKFSVSKDSATAPSVAVDLLSGQYTEDALQSLLPWLQGLQGTSAQNNGSDTQNTPEGEGLLPMTDFSAQLNVPVALPYTQQSAQPLPADSNADAKTAAKGGKDDLILSTSTLLAGSDTESETAKLAASGELLSSSEAKLTESLTESATQANTPQTARFDATLQAAKDQLSTQTGARNGEPVRITSSLGSPQWQSELGDQVHLMSRQNESRAELILTPPQLGRIEISLDIKGDQASALFISANPEVRAALENAMDRLRDVLAGNGIALNQSQVGSESPNGSASSDHGSKPNNQGLAQGNDDVSAPTTPAWTRHNNNMLDVFA